MANHQVVFGVGPSMDAMWITIDNDFLGFAREGNVINLEASDKISFLQVQTDVNYSRMSIHPFGIRSSILLGALTSDFSTIGLQKDRNDHLINGSATKIHLVSLEFYFTICP
jgi:hypothetical protein